MRDGTRLAVDVTLPHGHSHALPTILRQTRYHRGMRLRPPFDRPPFRQLFDQQHHARQYFVSRGYAWVDVCARGSGASEGRRPSPWAAAERADGAEVLTWIARQPWANGRIGARGISYDGTAAEFLLLHNHPALAAVAPRFSLFDVYDDIAMPGGIHLAQFTENWAKFNDALDRNRFDHVLDLVLLLSRSGRQQLGQSELGGGGDLLAANVMRLRGPLSAALGRIAQGVARTEGDPTGEFLAEILARREGALNVFEAASRMTFRDDGGLSKADPELRLQDFSPHAMPALASADVPVFHYTGWYDGAYQRAAIKRFHARDHPADRLIIGPWEHGGRQNISPWERSREVMFDHEAELLRFFDAHTTTRKGAAERWSATPRVRYFVIGAERWEAADRWRPQEAEAIRYFLGEDRQLCERANSEEAFHTLPVGGEHGSGEASRWRCLLPLLAHTHYTGQHSHEVCKYDSAPLPGSVEVTGHPRVRVTLTSTSEDPRLFAYLEDVAPDGRTRYVTEGQLRAIHRKLETNGPRSHDGLPYRTYLKADSLAAPPGEALVLEFDLLPAAYRFGVGHRIRLVLAGADRDHFELAGLGTHRIHLSGSFLELPVVP